MATVYENLLDSLRARPRSWLVTGAGGFIGSNICEKLLQLDQSVVGLDNFSTGKRGNLEEVRSVVAESQWARMRMVVGDIRDLGVCQEVCSGVDFVLHQAALGSVPRSIEDPIGTNEANIVGFLNMLVAARDRKVGRFVYAASSSTYGDHPALPKQEDAIGRALSPYAVTKYVNELYADVFRRCYRLNAVGLRYFNVFGRRQDPEGAYAAVIPRWVSAMIRNEPVQINGDGETSRDFCYIDNIIQANLLAACVERSDSDPSVFNVANGDRTTLNELFRLILVRLQPRFPHLKDFRPVFKEFRAGDVRHSEASIERISRVLGYRPSHNVEEGLGEALNWYEGRVAAAI